MARIVEVEGIGEIYAKKLQEIGIKTTEALLEKGSTSKGRAELAKESGISDKLILKWVNHVDLFRVKGIGPQYAELLEAAGVDTVPELGQRKPENLHPKLVETNAAKKLVRQVPSLKRVLDWVDQAKRLPRVVKY
jgi:predicted flap endonuclease-1-like 5' DNA nuclease